jgi:hypothetical protein
MIHPSADCLKQSAAGIHDAKLFEDGLVWWGLFP